MSAELTDVLKGDLARLWIKQIPELDPCFSSPANCASVKIGTADIDDDLYNFIVRLHYFFMDTLTSSSKSSSEVESRTLESLYFIFFHRDRDQEQVPVPRLHHNRQVIPLDFASLQSEVEFYDRQHFPAPTVTSDINSNRNKYHSFASYLHNEPEKAISALECSLLLVMTSLYRTYHMSHQDNNSPFLSSSHQRQLHQASTTVRFVVRIYNLGDGHHHPLTDIKTNFVHKCLSIKGQVTKVQPKRLRVTSSEFSCQKCSCSFRQKFHNGKYNVPSKCTTPKCRSKSFVLLRSTAHYMDYQEIKIQETQEEYTSFATTSGGRTPKTLEIQISGNDLVDVCRAGDIICVVGVVKAMNTAIKAGRTGRGALETSTYQLFLKANSISVLGNSTTSSNLHHKDSQNKSSPNQKQNSKGVKNNSRDTASNFSFTREQLKRITKLAHADPKMGSLRVRAAFPFDLLVRSLCPAIIGHDLVKAGILLALLGGTPSASSFTLRVNPTTVRSNSHILIVGDPGMGKSQMLLAATQIASRSVYVGGNTASSTGLTVSLTKEKGGEVGIEAGALVLADRGVCCIDEFDKMTKTNQDGLLETMEQQQISIAKAGIVASLPSRCSVIAAANPKAGSYDMNRSVAENLNMNTPILSRFDLVFILRDGSNRVNDGLITKNIMNLYRGKSDSMSNNGNWSGAGSATKKQKYNNTPQITSNDGEQIEWVPLETRLKWVSSFQKDPIPANLIKDYISYARQYCFPKLTGKAAAVLQDYFLELR